MLRSPTLSDSRDRQREQPSADVHLKVEGEAETHRGVVSKGGWRPPLLPAQLLVVVVERGLQKGPAVEHCSHLPVTSQHLLQILLKPGIAGSLHLSGIALFLLQHAASYTCRKRHISFPRRFAQHCSESFSIRLQVC